MKTQKEKECTRKRSAPLDDGVGQLELVVVHHAGQHRPVLVALVHGVQRHVLQRLLQAARRRRLADQLVRLTRGDRI